MPCPPQVPISIIPPVAQGPSPILWQNGNQITRLNTPLNPSWLIYDGSTTRWGDGSSQSPIILPGLQEITPSNFAYFVGFTSAGVLGKSSFLPNVSNIAGGSAGQILYQTSTNNTGFVSVGTSGQLLQSNGTASPSWINQSSIVVGTTVNFTGSLSGDVTGTQSATSVVKVNGASVPTNKTIIGTNSLGQIIDTSSATLPNNISGNAATASYASVAGSTSLASSASYATLAGSASLSTLANYASNLSLVGSNAGSVPYQISSNTTSFLSAGTNGQVLTSTGSGLTWTSGVAASVAGGITGGTSGQLLVQTGNSTLPTTFINTLASGVLHANGSLSPSWSSVTPSDLSTGAPIWDTLGNFSVLGGLSGGSATLTGIVNASTINSGYASLTGSLTGNVSGTSSGFTGSLSGDVTGTQSATSVSKVNGAIIPTSKTIVGTNSSGQIVDASTATLSNNTTGNATSASTAQASSTLALITAKAWVNFNGTGTIGSNQSVRSSHNVSSVSKTGNGAYTINFQSALADANYSVAGSASAQIAQLILSPLSAAGTTTTSCKIFVSNTSTAGNNEMVCVQIFGN